MKADQPKSPTKFFTIREIAESVGSSERTIQRWIKNGLLIAHSLGGLVRISEGDFQAFLAARRGQ
jgi:excisionase family DNA binding protein